MTGWYRVIVTDKPEMETGEMFWIWRIVNGHGHIVAQCVHWYRTEAAARRASRRILENVTWRLFPGRKDRETQVAAREPRAPMARTKDTHPRVRRARSQA